MAEFGLARYLKELRRLPMVEPQEGHLLAKRWREDAQSACHQQFGPRSASMPAWALVTSELADCAYRDADFDAVTQLETGNMSQSQCKRSLADM